MKKKTVSLKKQFLARLFLVLIAIVFFTTVLQIVFIKTQINNHLVQQSRMLSQSIEQGIRESEQAAKSIEYQIDLKLLSYAYRIGDLLEGKDWEEITNEELVRIRDSLGIAGITIMAEQGDDIVGVRATDPEEIGFSFKKVGYIEGYNVMKHKLAGKKVADIAKEQSLFTYEEEHAFVSPIAQSGSHGNTPRFFKYAYYVKPGTDYIIDPYIEANEIYQFTENVGTQNWIEKVTVENPYIMEIAVVNPVIYQNPEMEKKLYPPKKKVLYGSTNFLSDRDQELLIGMIDTPKMGENVDYVETINDKKLYKVFLPVDKERVIYAALDYDKIIEPLYRHSVYLIVFGIIAIVALFLITASFFDSIYQNIQRIKQQIQRLEEKDFTAKSHVPDGNELGDLSVSANRMVDTLHRVLLNTSDQASKVQRLSMMLENEASQSVEKMYTVSMEMTMKERESVDEMVELLDQVKEQIQSPPNEKNQEVLEKIRRIREIARNRASTTTDFTITLSDLLKSLHSQSKELADISDDLLKTINQFKL